jgi:hypothetical protein
LPLQTVETTALNAAVRVLPLVGRKLYDKRKLRKLCDAASAVYVSGDASSFLEGLSSAQLKRFDGLISSGQFRHLMHQTMICTLKGQDPDDLASLREQVRITLSHDGTFAGADLLQATDVTFDLLRNSVIAVGNADPSSLRTGHAVAASTDISAMWARNSDLCRRVTELAGFIKFADQVRSQAKQLFGKLRLPNVVTARSVPYSQLYVPPLFAQLNSDSFELDLDLDTVVTQQLRTVVLGDPGAGKSTLARKLVYDLAADKLENLLGVVPILLVVRDHTQSIKNEHELVEHYLKAACRKSYNLDPPDEALEYLLMNGRAVVVIDGVDELGDARFRESFASSVVAFATLYPLVTLVTTSRTVGYEDAPLDRSLFSDVRVKPFNRRQVETYSKRWFQLDESVRKMERKDLASAFLADSAELDDLRMNPLLLSLLCALYSSEHYIPRNRPEVYQKCADLLFDKWDRSRGIEVRQELGAYVRTAIRRLAWRIFTDPQGRQALPKAEIRQFLATEVLAKRFAEEDEAIQAAEDFLDFCTGRAWVLTDIGTDRKETRYGFVHRTFLEYFAAAQLVKQDPTPSAVWRKLRPHLHEDSDRWAVVSSLAVQILDGERDDGGDSLLRLALGVILQNASDTLGNLESLSFCTALLRYISPNTDTLTRIVDLVLKGTCTIPVRRRLENTHDGGGLAVDAILEVMLGVTLPENSVRAGRIVAELISELAVTADVEDSTGCVYVALKMGFLDELDNYEKSVAAQVQEALALREMPDVAAYWNRVLFLPSADVVESRGIRSLFESARILGITLYPPAVSLLASALGAPGDGSKVVRIECLSSLYPTVARLAEEVATVEGWRSIGRHVEWRPVTEVLSHGALSALPVAARGSAALLLLAFFADTRGEVLALEDQRIRWVATARQESARRSAAVEAVNSWNLPEIAHTLLIRWIHAEL